MVDAAKRKPVHTRDDNVVSEFLPAGHDCGRHCTVWCDSAAECGAICGVTCGATCGSTCVSIGGVICMWHNVPRSMWRNMWRSVWRDMRRNMWRKTRRVTGRNLWSSMCAMCLTGLWRGCMHYVRTVAARVYSKQSNGSQVGSRLAPLLFFVYLNSAASE